MDSINRQIAIIKPKKPYVNWINSLPGMDEPSSIESLNNDCTALLLPHFDDDDDSLKFIKKYIGKYLRLNLIVGVPVKMHGRRKEPMTYFVNGSKLNSIQRSSILVRKPSELMYIEPTKNALTHVSRTTPTVGRTGN